MSDKSLVDRYFGTYIQDLAREQEALEAREANESAWVKQRREGIPLEVFLSPEDIELAKEFLERMQRAGWPRSVLVPSPLEENRHGYAVGVCAPEGQLDAKRLSEPNLFLCADFKLKNKVGSGFGFDDCVLITGVERKIYEGDDYWQTPKYRSYTDPKPLGYVLAKYLVDADLDS